MKKIEQIKKTKFEGLEFPILTEGHLIKRYKRFLADVKLNSGEIVTAHCSNTGRMSACSKSGQRVFLSYHNKKTRKLKYSWELIDMSTSLVGVNTILPNRLIYQTLKSDQIPELEGYEFIQREVTVTPESRLDIEIFNSNSDRCFIEIKNCTWVEEGIVRFPDAVSVRGQKHLKELQLLKQKNHRAVIFFLVQRMDAVKFQPADHIDPAYGKALRDAYHQGVEILVYDVKITPQRIKLNRSLLFQL